MNKGMLQSKHTTKHAQPGGLVSGQKDTTMKQQAAIAAAERKAKRDHTIMFVVYDPSDHEATTPNDAYFPATPEEESIYFRGAECVAIFEPEDLPVSVFAPLIQTCTPVLPGFEQAVKPAWQVKHGGAANLDNLPMFNQKG